MTDKLKATDHKHTIDHPSQMDLRWEGHGDHPKAWENAWVKEAEEMAKADDELLRLKEKHFPCMRATDEPCES